MWAIGSRTVWTPVENLDLSLEVMYNKLNTAFGGATSGSEQRRRRHPYARPELVVWHLPRAAELLALIG